MVRMFNQNMQAFRDGMAAMDAMMHVSQRVQHDILNMPPFCDPSAIRCNYDGVPISVYRDPDGMVDFPRYIREYYGTLGFAEFVGAWKAWRAVHHVVPLGGGRFDIISAVDVARESAEEMSAAVVGAPEETDELTTEFGGDAGGVVDA